MGSALKPRIHQVRSDEHQQYEKHEGGQHVQPVERSGKFDEESGVFFFFVLQRGAAVVLFFLLGPTTVGRKKNAEDSARGQTCPTENFFF